MATMSPLRQRMIEDMTVRNLSPSTQQSYIYAIAKFSRHFGDAPDRLSFEQVRAYQLHLIGQKRSWSHINQVACALRFFYGVTLGQTEAFERIIGGQKPDKLPLVLSAEEIKRFLDAATGVRNRVVLATAYAADRHEHVFALTQSLELYDVYQAKMLECDRKLEVLISALNTKGARPVRKLAKPRVKTKQVNTPTFDVRTALYGVLGVDLTEIHGLGPSLALKLIGECGTDLSAWPSVKHFTSWLCLAPGNKISGGKVLSSRTRRSSSPAAALLRLAATTVGRSETALGAFYRRLSSRAGKSKAVTATARKIAVLFYNTLRHGMSYRDPGADQYEQQYRSRVLANLQRRAKSLGFVLQAIPGDANPAVS